MRNQATAATPFENILKQSTINFDGLTFFGDPHGRFDELLEAGLQHDTDCLLITGDFFDRSFSGTDVDNLRDTFRTLESANCEFYYVTGNHDSASLAVHNLLHREFSHHNLNRRIMSVGKSNVRIAGLGGVFRGKVWFPKTNESADEKKFSSADELLKATPRNERIENWLPLKHRETIFPHDFQRLLQQGKADILLSHEAPMSNPNGFWALDHLAHKLGVTLVVHGHHHVSSECYVSTKTAVKGLNLAEKWSYEHSQTSKGASLDDELDNYFEKNDTPSLMILSKIGDQNSSGGKKLSQQFHKYTQQKLPLKTIDVALQSSYETLTNEFPWASKIIEQFVGNMAVAINFSKSKPILRLEPTLLIGAKGTGKTSLVKRLCEVIEIPMQLISASMTDSGGFMPVARGWSTSQPSSLFTFMIDHKCANPAIFIDELDKAAAIHETKNGNLQATLLSMIGEDKFFDNCLLGDLDLSHVSWLSTANSTNTIFGPLLDRFSILEMAPPKAKHSPIVMQNIKKEVAKMLRCEEELLPNFSDFETSEIEHSFTGEHLSLRDLKRDYMRHLQQHSLKKIGINFHHNANKLSSKWH